MIVNAQKVKISIIDIINLAASVLFLIGINFWFPVCEPLESGFMTCHWAGEVLGALSVVFVIISAAHLAIGDGNVKMGMSIAAIGFYTFAFCVPGRIIPLCKMPEMDCRAHTQLMTAVFMVVFMLISIADIIFWTSKTADEKHKRKGEKA